MNPLRSLRGKTVLLLVFVTLVPVLCTVLLLVRANTRPVLDAEEKLQSAVAAVLARAADGKIRDQDAILAAQALVGDRETSSSGDGEAKVARLMLSAVSCGAWISSSGSSLFAASARWVAALARARPARAVARAARRAAAAR
jgi:hypothetical protein